MKKTVKTLIAVILAAVIAMGSMSAFAANEKTVWDFYGEEYEYTFKCQLAEGVNSLSMEGDDLFLCYEFEAEKDGYYFFYYNWEDLCNIEIAEKNSTGRYNVEDCVDFTSVYFYDEDGSEDYSIDRFFCFLEEGTYVVATDKYDESVGGTIISIEYAGEKLTGFDFEGGVKYNLIPDYNISCWEEDGVVTYNFTPGKTKLTFDSGKTYDIFLYGVDFETETEITEGEYDITVEFCGETFEKTISVYDITHDVKSIEVKNFDKYNTVKEYYDGCLEYDLEGLEYVIEFADGRKETIVSGRYGMMGIDLQNGNPAYIFLGYGCEKDENGNVSFVMTLGGHEYVNLPVEKIEASKLEDSKHLAEENISEIEDEFYMLQWNFEDVIRCFNTEWFFSTLSFFLKDLFTLVPAIANDVFGNIMQFMAA